MNKATKKLFLILPKGSDAEIFGYFSSNIDAMKKSNVFGNFLLNNTKLIKHYNLLIDANEITKASELMENMKKKLASVPNVVVRFSIGDNTKLFGNIQKNYQKDAQGICQRLMKILSNLEPVLKKFQIVDELFEFKKIIIAAHLGGLTIDSYIDIQHSINMYLSRQQNEMKKLKFVYFSAAHDEPHCNKFIRNHKTFSKYSYAKLIKEKSDQQFNYFLELLEARAEEEEIKYFNTVITKKYINNLIEIFLPTAIDCNGIQQLNIMNQDTTRYKEEAFKGFNFEKYLGEIWVHKDVKSTFYNLSGLLHKKAENFRPKIDALREAAGPEEFTRKFKEFIDAATSLKKSLNLSDIKT
jgi:uncharacterized protein YukE